VHNGLKPSLKIIPVILAVLSILYAATGQHKTNLSTMPFNAQAYRVGERLTYDVSFAQFVSAAHIELFVAARGTFFGRDGIQLLGHVETTGVVNAALFAVNNDYTTYVDPGSGLPFRVEQIVREAGRTSDTASDYNPSAGTSTYDLLAAIYRVRAMPLSDGSSYVVVVHNEGDTYQAELKVEGHELVKTKVGSFNAIVVRLNVSKSSLKDYRIRVYFSDDERHLPVLMTARLPAGEVRAELAATEMGGPARPTATPRSSPNPVTPPPTVNNPTLPTNPRTELPFKVGEQLNYRIFLPKIDQPVGTALFEVKAQGRYFDRNGFWLLAQAQTTGAAGRLFSASDRINSYVDPTTLLPFRTELALVEGGRATNRTYTVDQDRGSALFEKGGRIDIPVGTHDLISLLYAIRTFELTPPKRNAISILVGNRPATLFISSLRRETIDIGGQKLPAVMLSLTTDDQQSDKFQMRAWVSDDSRRLPLRFTAVTELGLLRADLTIIPVTPQ